MKFFSKHRLRIGVLLFVLSIGSCKNDDDISTLEDRGVALNFAIREVFVQENASEGVQITITFLAATVQQGSVEIEILPEEGLVYDTDFTTVPDGSSGQLTFNIPEGSTETSFTVFPKNLLGEDSTKSIVFKIKNTTGGVFKGTKSEVTLFITDEPIILIVADITDFGDVEQGFSSVAQSYTVSAVSLVDNLEITAPEDYEVSSDASSFSSTLSLASADFTNNEAVIYIKLAPMGDATLGTSSGSILHSATGAKSKEQIVSGTVIAPIPAIIIEESLTDFGNLTPGQQSASQVYTVEGHALTENVVINSSANFEVSTDDITFSSSVSLDYVAIEGNPTDVYVRFAPTSIGAISEDIAHSSTDAPLVNLTVSGTGEDPFVTIAFTSFEEPLVEGEYIDTQNNDVDHDMVNNAGQDKVDFTSTGGEMGFDATYIFTRQFNTPKASNAIGAVNDVSDVVAYTDGSQGYKLTDVEGTAKVVFDNVDITGFTSVSIDVDLFIKPSPLSSGTDTYEETDQNGMITADRVRLYVIVDGGVELDIVNEDSNGNLNAIASGVWETKTLDLTNYTNVQLVFEVDTNVPSEGAYIDNVRIKGLN